MPQLDGNRPWSRSTTILDLTLEEDLEMEGEDLGEVTIFKPKEGDDGEVEKLAGDVLR
jgi:hypothetical protein